MPPFTLRKVAFQAAKGGLLEAKTWSFATPWISRGYKGR